MYMYTLCMYVCIHVYSEQAFDVRLIDITIAVTLSLPCCNDLGSDHKFQLCKCSTPAGLSTFWGWALPTLGCLCKALPNIETSTETNTKNWQMEILELLVFSDPSLWIDHIPFRHKHDVYLA